MKQHPRAPPQGPKKKQIPRQDNHCIIEVFFLTIVLIPDPQFGQVVLTEESPLTLGGPLIGAAKYIQSYTQVQFIKTNGIQCFEKCYFCEMQLKYGFCKKLLRKNETLTLL